MDTEKILVREISKFTPLFITAGSDTFKIHVDDHTYGIEVIMGDSSRLFLPEEGSDTITVKINKGMFVKKD